MDEFIKILDPALDYVEHIAREQKCIITVESNRKIVTCPYCGTASSRVHSVYKREFQDLPIQDHQVVILIKNRKMFCENPECSHQTFSERFDFITYKARKTERLIKKILNLSSRVSSVAASTMLKNDTAAISKSTICRLLKKNASDCG
ncbi:transposase family protein [Candidatus Desulfosporosinus nitrosoreducens]|uniref:transposase family protein n=1 Tax=Candidatus Desulfosporosinus nitrosoreducens TaxID=3401928 RepID=UPI00280A9896|nr:transposase family protein [Desulfosporosinus sp. PR]